jgi:hypothetical protein
VAAGGGKVIPLARPKTQAFPDRVAA